MLLCGEEGDTPYSIDKRLLHQIRVTPSVAGKGKRKEEGLFRHTLHIIHSAYALAYHFHEPLAWHICLDFPLWTDVSTLREACLAS
jgi:hypothetical protein